MTAAPARIFGLAGGTLAKGAPADWCCWIEDEPFVVDAEKLHSRARNTAFEGRKFQGRASVTFVGGVCVFDAPLDFLPCGLASSRPCLDPVPIALALGYLLGTIPFGLFFTWLSGAGDVRKIGSGNIGATNVLRTGKKWAAAATLLCDGAKGAAAVLLARHFLPRHARSLQASARCWDICFPVWLGFKGGKGVATFLGVCLALYWPVGLLVAATWLGAAPDLAHLLACRR